MTIRIGQVDFDHVVYDSARDVLYLSVGEPQEPADSFVTPEGHAVRLNDENEVVGVTIINAKWLADRDGSINVSLPQPIQRDDLEPAFA